MACTRRPARCVAGVAGHLRRGRPRVKPALGGRPDARRIGRLMLVSAGYHDVLAVFRRIFGTHPDILRGLLNGS